MEKNNDRMEGWYQAMKHLSAIMQPFHSFAVPVAPWCRRGVRLWLSYFGSNQNLLRVEPRSASSRYRFSFKSKYTSESIRSMHAGSDAVAWDAWNRFALWAGQQSAVTHHQARQAISSSVKRGEGYMVLPVQAFWETGMNGADTDRRSRLSLCLRETNCK